MEFDFINISLLTGFLLIYEIHFSLITGMLLSIGLYLLNKNIINNKYLKGAYYSALAIIPLSIILIMYGQCFYLLCFMKTLSFVLLFSGIYINVNLRKIRILTIILIVFIIAQAIGSSSISSFPLLSPNITYRATWIFVSIGLLNCILGYIIITYTKKSQTNIKRAQ